MAEQQYPDFVNVVGRVGKDPFVKQANDTEVVATTVAKRTGFGEGQTVWYDVEVWKTKRTGEDNPLFSKVQGLRKGQLVAIEASEPKSRDYNGKTYLTLNPWNVWRVTDLSEEAGDDW